MAEQNIKSRIQLKTDTHENWEKATTFIPKKGEAIIYQEKDENYSQLKIGDNVHTVEELDFINAAERADIESLKKNKLEVTELPNAVNEALALAKASGEFDGEDGFSGVYLGEGDMPEGYNVQIDPNGDAMTIEELASAVIDMLPDYNGEAEDV